MEQKIRRGDDNEMSNIGVSTLPKLRTTPTEIWYCIYRFIKMCAGMVFFFFFSFKKNDGWEKLTLGLKRDSYERQCEEKSLGIKPCSGGRIEFVHSRHRRRTDVNVFSSNKHVAGTNFVWYVKLVSS